MKPILKKDHYLQKKDLVRGLQKPLLCPLNKIVYTIHS